MIFPQRAISISKWVISNAPSSSQHSPLSNSWSLHLCAIPPPSPPYSCSFRVVSSKIGRLSELGAQLTIDFIGLAVFTGSLNLFVAFQTFFCPFAWFNRLFGVLLVSGLFLTQLIASLRSLVLFSINLFPLGDQTTFPWEHACLNQEIAFRTRIHLNPLPNS